MKKKIKFLIFGAKNHYATRRIFDECKNMGIDCRVVSFNELIFEAGAKNEILLGDKKIEALADIVLIRATNKHHDEARILAEYLGDRNILVIDKNLVTHAFLSSKLADDFLFSKIKIQHPKTSSALGKKSINVLLKTFKYPIIVKDVHGQQSKGIYFLKNVQRAQTFFKWHNPKEFIIQEYLPSMKYLRILLIGSKVVGAIKRTKAGYFSDRATKKSRIAKSETYELNQEEIKLAKKAHSATKNDISGVDIMKIEGKLYVIEVNRVPQFSTFEKTTKINVAKEIVAYCLNVYKKRDR